MLACVGIMPPAIGTPPPHELHGSTIPQGGQAGALQGRIAAGAAIGGGIAPAGVKPGGRWPKHRSYFQTSKAMYRSERLLQPVSPAAASTTGTHAKARQIHCVLRIDPSS